MRKQLAIKGHENRGTEVIEILEMIGGKNNSKCMWNGNSIDLFYFVDEKGFIDGLNTWNDRNIEFDVFTLEKFLEKYPYKVGDKVYLDNKLCSIIWRMCWECNNIYYMVQGMDDTFTKKVTADKLKPYKEEVRLKDGKDPLHKLCESKLSSVMIDSSVCGDEVELILNDFEIEVRDGKTYAVKKKPKYPTTYEECCGVLGITYDFPDIKMVSTDEYILYSSFIQLIRCRDAYWKVAGEQMGLGKPWEPTMETVYCISRSNNIIKCSYRGGKSNILEFPTTEMRNAFYENFKDLIGKCEKLL